MPAADGKFQGIRVPRDIFVRVTLTIPQARALAYGLGSRDKSYREAHEEAVEAVRKAYDSR